MCACVVRWICTVIIYGKAALPELAGGVGLSFLSLRLSHFYRDMIIWSKIERCWMHGHGYEIANNTT